MKLKNLSGAYYVLTHVYFNPMIFQLWIIEFKSICIDVLKKQWFKNDQFFILLNLKIFLKDCIIADDLRYGNIIYYLLRVAGTFHILYYHKRAISCFQMWNLICETKKDINVKTETDSHCQHKHYLFRFSILSDSGK